MGHDVFISHSAKNKIAGDAVCATLESEGVRCWIAPRDVTPGMEWGECILDAIERAQVMVLVFSSDANASPQIRREVERAVNHGVAILPLRIEDVLPTKALEYFIGSVHWLDALTPPLEAHLKNLAGTVKLLLERMQPQDELPYSPPALRVEPLIPLTPRAEPPPAVARRDELPPPEPPRSAPAAVEPSPPPPAAGVATISHAYLPYMAAGQFPMAVAMPLPAPARKSWWVWLVGVCILSASGFFYYETRPPAQPDSTPPPQTQPAQQPGGGDGGNQDPAVLAAQTFTEGGYNNVNGQIQVTQGQWLNGSNVALAAAMLGCEQMDANSQNVAQDTVALTGPAAPGATVTLPTFSIGALAQGATNVNCKITAVQAED